ncbi:hypothetical protein P691DRAFT_813433 [Macrolepiota fuliginosa MF-IS2]|uniref:Secreted protein n=1 Tax=Macrolepiota fuliginosa MF-IS2 TaxID=1400762 RepID=A0A9P5X0P1_9AGAR|nr:hypothetical protein P691DRAFT_813433 [Macrolepiota fuliginosa MF-IS2]
MSRMTFPSVLLFTSLLLVVRVEGCRHGDDNGVDRRQRTGDRNNVDTLKRLGTERMRKGKGGRRVTQQRQMSISGEGMRMMSRKPFVSFFRQCTV